jgi:hypothetical protein
VKVTCYVISNSSCCSLVIQVDINVQSHVHVKISRERESEGEGESEGKEESDDSVRKTGQGSRSVAIQSD